MDANEVNIKHGSMVLLQKGSYTRPCKVITKRPQLFGGRRDGIHINFDGVIGEPFGSIYKIVKATAAGRKHSSLERVSWQQLRREDLHSDRADGESGVDNRNLTDDGSSQKLTKEQIEQIKESGASSKQLIEAITANSATFNTKTKYSQEKYVNKKGKKYDELVTLHKPSIDLIADMFFANEPFKILHMRSDSLFQLLLHSNLCPGGRAAVFDCGTLELVTAGMLHRLGRDSRLVHVFSGRKPFTGAAWTGLELMDFSNEELASLSNININRIHLAKKPGKPEGTEMKPLIIEEEKSSVPVSQDVENGETKSELPVAPSNTKPRRYCRNRSQDEVVSTAVLEAGVFSLVVACKQHPLVPTMALLPYLLPGCPFAVYCMYKEPLMELFQELKCSGGTNLHLNDTWMREYQVKPERTHPKVIMSGSGGFVLVGTKIRTGDQF